MSDIDSKQAISFELEEMDAEHRKVLEGLAQLTAVAQTDFPAAYSTLLRLIEDDFRAEELLMDEISYCDLQAHLKDHAGLLALLHRVKPFIDEGNMPLADVIRGMAPAMFIHHMSTMDMALANAVRMFRSGQMRELSFPEPQRA